MIKMIKDVRINNIFIRILNSHIDKLIPHNHDSSTLSNTKNPFTKFKTPYSNKSFSYVHMNFGFHEKNKNLVLPSGSFAGRLRMLEADPNL